MVMIETSAAPRAQAPEPEAQTAGPRRQRRAPAQAQVHADEPLVQIETRK